MIKLINEEEHMFGQKFWLNVTQSFPILKSAWSPTTKPTALNMWNFLLREVLGQKLSGPLWWFHEKRFLWQAESSDQFYDEHEASRMYASNGEEPEAVQAAEARGQKGDK